MWLLVYQTKTLNRTRHANGKPHKVVYLGIKLQHMCHTELAVNTYSPKGLTNNKYFKVLSPCFSENTYEVLELRFQYRLTGF